MTLTDKALVQEPQLKSNFHAQVIYCLAHRHLSERNLYVMMQLMRQSIGRVTGRDKVSVTDSDVTLLYV